MFIWFPLKHYRSSTFWDASNRVFGARGDSEAAHVAGAAAARHAHPGRDWEGAALSFLIYPKGLQKEMGIFLKLQTPHLAPSQTGLPL